MTNNKTSNKDNIIGFDNTLVKSRKFKHDRNLRVLDLHAQGASLNDITRHLLDENYGFISAERVRQIIKDYRKYLKGGQNDS